MCGRFVQAQGAQFYADHFGAGISLEESLDSSWNVAPTDRVYAVAEHHGERTLGTFQWGLVPWYARSSKVGARHINARAETLSAKAAFKDSFTRRRCLIPADGFYEWERLESGGKLAHYVYAPEGTPLALAGLWASWKDPDGTRLVTCTIVTSEPDEVVGRLHDRMPVVLTPELWDRWLDRDFYDESELTAMLAPPPPGVLAEHPVSSLVNDVRNNFSDLVVPLADPRG